MTSIARCISADKKIISADKIWYRPIKPLSADKTHIGLLSVSADSLLIIGIGQGIGRYGKKLYRSFTRIFHQFLKSTQSLFCGLGPALHLMQFPFRPTSDVQVWWRRDFTSHEGGLSRVKCTAHNERGLRNGTYTQWKSCQVALLWCFIFSTGHSPLGKHVPTAH